MTCMFFFFFGESMDEKKDQINMEVKEVAQKMHSVFGSKDLSLKNHILFVLGSFPSDH